MTSRSTLIAAEQITSPRVGAMHRYWQSKCRDGSPPLRAAIDPTEIPRLLPYLVIAEIEASPMRVRYRLVGTQVVEDNGSDFTNRYLEDCHFAVEPLLHECYRRLVETRAPVFAYYEWHKEAWLGAKGAVERDGLLSAQQRRDDRRSRDLPRRSKRQALCAQRSLSRLRLFRATRHRQQMLGQGLAGDADVGYGGDFPEGAARDQPDREQI